ncbi:MAG: hypothetical protein KGH64_02890 [Candidatus Micrarchaeota archaeon]|nr:hypothetical protein [Candidatus Micrarchaeota archaeon]
MDKIRPTHSDCCNAEIEFDKPILDFHGHICDHKDVCKSCNKPIGYGLVGPFHGESMAVCKLYDGNLWFFWQQVDSWKYVEESDQEYIGQIKDVVDSIGLRYNTQDTDMISAEAHRRFANDYKSKVKNPQYAFGHSSF